MELDAGLDYVRTRHRGVLVTERANGKPQLSNVTYHLGSDNRFQISITADRAKYHNLVRTPWAALHVTSDDFYSYVVVEAQAVVSPIAARRSDEVVEDLVTYYRSVAGEHEDWDAYRASMVADRRVLLRLSPTRAYGMLPRS